MKIYFDSIGCRLNQSEIEKMATQLAGNGWQVVAHASQADIVVINTCAVTSAASSDSRQKIRQVMAASGARIIVTGCYATLESKNNCIDPSRIQIVPNSMKGQIAADLMPSLIEDLAADGTIHPRVIFQGVHKRTRAFIKVQEGCDNACTFCITRIARGNGRSQPIKDIHADIDAAILGGAKEIVLTGTNLGSWGRDLKTTANLANLVKDILKKYRNIRVRLSSLEPWDIDEALIEVMGNAGFCCHLHLPVQSGCDAILQKMNRPITAANYERILESIRRRIPEIAITTDIMVGFPGESENHFRTSLDFIERMDFAGGHVFRYSPRPGTLACANPDMVDAQISKRRSILMRGAIQRMSDQYHSRFSGTKVKVLWETTRNPVDGWMLLHGLTDNYIRVETEYGFDLQNTFSMVLLESWNGKRYQGKIVE